MNRRKKLEIFAHNREKPKKTKKDFFYRKKYAIIYKIVNIRHCMEQGSFALPGKDKLWD